MFSVCFATAWPRRGDGDSAPGEITGSLNFCLSPWGVVITVKFANQARGTPGRVSTKSDLIPSGATRAGFAFWALALQRLPQTRSHRGDSSLSERFGSGRMTLLSLLPHDWQGPLPRIFTCPQKIIHMGITWRSPPKCCVEQGLKFYQYQKIKISRNRPIH